MTYTIWMCCGNFEHEDTTAEAVRFAASVMNSGEGHRVLGVEGPNGEDFLTEAEEESDRVSDEWRKQDQETRRNLLGYVEVKGPTGKWWGRACVYSVEQRDQEMAEMHRLYGEDRVQFVKRPESHAYQSMGATKPLD